MNPMDAFRTVDFQQSFTEGGEEPFDPLELGEIPPTDYGAFVLEALAMMRVESPPQEEPSASDPSPTPARSEAPEPSSSLVTPSPPSPAKKRKRGEDAPAPSGSSSSEASSSGSGSSEAPLASSSTSTSTPGASSSSGKSLSASSSIPALSSSVSQSTATASSSSSSSSPPGGSINQDILRQSLRLASSFLLTDATMNPEAGIKTWSTGLSRLIEIILALHKKDALEVETMRVAALALRECWTAGGNFPGLEYSRERIRQDGLRLKKLCDDPTHYKGQVIT